MISYKLHARETKIELDADGYYHIPIGDRYSPAISDLQRTTGNPNFTLDTILLRIGLRYVKRPPGVDYELWEPNPVHEVPITPTLKASYAAPQISAAFTSDGARRFNLTGDTFGGESGPGA